MRGAGRVKLTYFLVSKHFFMSSIFQLDEMLDDMVFHAPNYQSMYMPGLDSDTEGESTTSSPVLARKHYEDDTERFVGYFPWAKGLGDYQGLNPIIPSIYKMVKHTLKVLQH